MKAKNLEYVNAMIMRVSKFHNGKSTMFAFYILCHLSEAHYFLKQVYSLINGTHNTKEL